MSRKNRGHTHALQTPIGAPATTNIVSLTCEVWTYKSVEVCRILQCVYCSKMNTKSFLTNQLSPGLPVHPGLLGLLRRAEPSTNYGPFRTTLVACIKYSQDARGKKVCSSQVVRRYVYTSCTNKFCIRNGIYIKITNMPIALSLCTNKMSKDKWDTQAKNRQK